MLPARTNWRHDVERPPGASLRCESGATLIELLVYIITSLVVFGAVTTFLIGTFRTENSVVGRTTAASRAEVGLEQLELDLRNAMTSISVSTAGATTTASFYLPTPNSDTTGQLVTWTCPSTAAPVTTIGACTRTLAGATRTEIVGVQSMTFTPFGASGSALTLPVTNSTTVASMGLKVYVDILNQEGPGPATVVAGSNASSGSPSILLQTTADLENFA